MSSNLRALAINRNNDPELEDDAKSDTSLENEVALLIASGWDVTESYSFADLDSSYDLILAHPPMDGFRELSDFRDNYPHIPIIVHSRMYRVLTELTGEKEAEYDVDVSGVYYNRHPTIRVFSKLLEKLKAINE